MRIISQDGMVDFPYENIAISTGHRGDNKEFYIFANFVNCAEQKPQILARYSTEKKAEKAMEMLREHNEGVIFLKTIINTEKCTPFIRNLSKTDFDKLTQNYFQFPQDDEIEV